MSTKSLGTLTLDIVARIGGYEQGLQKAEREAQKRAKAIEQAFDAAKIGVAATFAAIGASAVAAFAAFDQLVKQAGDFQDLAEKTGASAEALASFAVSAKVGGANMEDVAGASQKLSKALVGVDDDSKAAGAALSALGIPIKEFKTLDPAAQMEAVAKALAGFEDGASKTAIAMALFGKAGANLLPFFKELAGAQGRQSILTAEQIKLADEYADAQARSRAQLNLYAQAVATEAIPAFNAVTNAAKDFIKELVGVRDESNTLKLSSTILDWAETVSIAIATVVEAGTGAIKALRALGGSVESVYADAKLLEGLTPQGQIRNTLNGVTLKDLLENRNKVAKEANDRYVNLWNYDGTRLTSALRKNFAEQRRLMNPVDRAEAARMARQAEQAVGGQKVLKFNGAVTPDKDAGQVLKKELDGQLKAIRDFAEDQRNAYEFANNYLKSTYENGVLDLRTFFADQQAVREQALAAQIQSIDKEIAALTAYRDKTVKPQDRVDAENKIADAVRKRAEVTQKASQDNILRAGEEARAIEAIGDRYNDLRATILQLQGDTAGAAALRITKQIEDARKLVTQAGGNPALVGQYQALLQNTQALSEAQKNYNNLLAGARTQEEAIMLAARESGASELETFARIRDARQGSLAQMSAMVDKARELAAVLGTPEATQYADQLANAFKRASLEVDPLVLKVQNVGKEIGDSIAGGLADAIVEGQGLRDVFKAMEKDILRIITNKIFTEPFGKWLGDAIGGTGNGTGFLGNLFGSGGGTKGNNPSAFTSGSSGGGWLDMIGKFFSGFFAEGGMIPAGHFGVVGERGAELVSGPARVTPMDKMGGSTVIINQTFAPGTDRKTINQAAAAAGQRLQVAIARTT